MSIDLQQIRMRLEMLATTAGELSKTFGKGGRELDRQERWVMKALAVSEIQALMEEATMFALTGNKEDMFRGVEQASEWIELVR